MLDEYDTEEYLGAPVLYLGGKEGPLQPLIVEAFHPMSESQALLSIEGTDDRVSAEALVGSKLFFPKEDLPPLAAGHFYFFQVIGFTVVDDNQGPLGVIEDFAGGEGTQHIMIMRYQGHEVLIPVVEEVVGLADFEAKVVRTTLPDGLVEMYMGIEEDEDKDD